MRCCLSRTELSHEMRCCYHFPDSFPFKIPSRADITQSSRPCMHAPPRLSFDPAVRTCAPVHFPVLISSFLPPFFRRRERFLSFLAESGRICARARACSNAVTGENESRFPVRGKITAKNYSHLIISCEKIVMLQWHNFAKIAISTALILTGASVNCLPIFLFRSKNKVNLSVKTSILMVTRVSLFS